jgi:hypothetical protein
VELYRRARRRPHHPLFASGRGRRSCAVPESSQATTTCRRRPFEIVRLSKPVSSVGGGSVPRRGLPGSADGAASYNRGLPILPQKSNRLLLGRATGVRRHEGLHTWTGKAEKSPLLASSPAAGERPAISRHSRHCSRQVAFSKQFAPMTRNSKPLTARVIRSAFASCAGPFVWVVPFYGIDPMGGRCGSVLRCRLSISHR